MPLILPSQFFEMWTLYFPKKNFKWTYWVTWSTEGASWTIWSQVTGDATGSKFTPGSNVTLNTLDEKNDFSYLYFVFQLQLHELYCFFKPSLLLEKKGEQGEVCGQNDMNNEFGVNVGWTDITISIKKTLYTDVIWWDVKAADACMVRMGGLSHLTGGPLYPFGPVIPISPWKTANLWFTFTTLVWSFIVNVFYHRHRYQCM